MRTSQFNVYDSEHEPRLLYNSLNGGLAALDDVHAHFYESVELWDRFPEFLSEMKAGGYIVEEGLDEVARIEALSNALRKDSHCGAYTIAPTLACNFQCPYCYESGYRHHAMDAACAESVVAFLKKQVAINHYSSLDVAWYGGEPLLALDTISAISQGIVPEVKTYTAGIVTNGYLLDGKTAELLSSLSVRHAQVTLDGPPAIHNKRRCLPSGADTFHSILRNIAEAASYLAITIRVNVDKENERFIDEIATWLDYYGLKNRVYMYLAAVDDVNEACSSSSCLRNHEFSALEASYYDRHLLDGYCYVSLPAANLSVCGAIAPNSWVIDPRGDLYKCWDDVGRKERACGSVHEGLACSENVELWNSYNPVDSSACRSCELLPVCMGGCPHDSVLGRGRRCMALKENCVAMMRLAYRQREMVKRGHGVCCGQTD